MLVHIWCAPTWRFHTELYKFLRNISPNICGLGERTDLKLGEVSCLFIFNRITISWLYPLNGFRLLFYCVTVKTIYTHNLTLAHHRVSCSSLLEHPTRSRRVVGSNPIWVSDFFRVYVFPRIYIISCCYFSVSKTIIPSQKAAFMFTPA